MNSHLKRKKNYPLLLFLSFIPLIIFAIYKYGYMPYNRNLLSIGESFKVLYLILISFFLSFIFKKIFKFNNYIYIENLILTFLLPINIPYYLYILLLSIYSILKRLLDRFHINSIVISKLIIIGILILLNKYNYASIYEDSINSMYNIFDVVGGMNINGIGCSNSILLLLIYIYLSNIDIYKKNIPIYCLFSYIISLSIIGILSNNLIYLYKLTFKSSILYSFLYVSTTGISSPIDNKWEIIYSIIIGILSSIFIQYNLYEGPLISILISNILLVILKRIDYKKKLI